MNIDTDSLKLDWRYVAGRNSLWTLSQTGRKVIYCRALSNRVTQAYVEAVPAEIHSV